MDFKDMPTWMNLIPAALGSGLALLGILVLPHFGIRNVLGPIIGLPVGVVLGFGIVYLMIRNR